MAAADGSGWFGMVRDGQIVVATERWFEIS
jgi:hypothetical protein